MIKHILMPLDGSPEGEGALPYVAAIAGGLRAEVTILHVVGGSRAVTGRLAKQPESRAYLEQLQADSERLAQTYLARQAKRLQDLEIPTEVSTLFGQPSEVIAGYGGENRPDLIAMCTHGRSGLSRTAMGSVAGYLLNKARSPLLLVRTKEDVSRPVVPVKNVVVPLDSSGLAEAALPIAKELATGLDLTITLALAIPRLSQLYLGTEMVTHPAAILERSEGEAGEYLQEVAGRLESDGLAVSWKILHGDPARSIVEFASQSRDNVIAMATHGRSGLGRWVLGSVTDKVVRTSESPVLVVRPTKS